VPDQVRFHPQVVGPAVHVKDDRLLALIRIRGDAETIFAPVAGEKRPEDGLDIRREIGGKNRHAIVQFAGNALLPRGSLHVDAPADLRGTRAARDSRVQNPFGRSEVVVQQVRRDMQHLGARVEAAGGRIDGQHVLEFDLDAQEVAHRVLVLGLVQAPHDRAPLPGIARGLGRRDLAVDPVGQGLRLIGGRTRLSFRRHRPRL